MMLVAADGIETALGGVFELVEELVVHAVRTLGIEQRRMNINPHGRMLLPEVVGQLLVGHQMEPQEFHGQLLPCRRRGTTRQYEPQAAGIQGIHTSDLPCSVLIAGQKRIIVPRGIAENVSRWRKPHGAGLFGAIPRIAGRGARLHHQVRPPVAQTGGRTPEAEPEGPRLAKAAPRARLLRAQYSKGVRRLWLAARR